MMETGDRVRIVADLISVELSSRLGTVVADDHDGYLWRMYAENDTITRQQMNGPALYHQPGPRQTEGLVPMHPQFTPPRVCSAPDCDRKILARGLCEMHYARFMKQNPDLPRIAAKNHSIPPAIERFQKKVEILESGCWKWIGSKHDAGYGRMSPGGKKPLVFAHRWSYEYFVGPIPENLEIDHLCRNRWCVNPEHLEAVTRHENQIRGMSPPGRNYWKTHCIRGHAFTPENTYVTPKGGRNCRACQREMNRLGKW